MLEFFIAVTIIEFLIIIAMCKRYAETVTLKNEYVTQKDKALDRANDLLKRIVSMEDVHRLEIESLNNTISGLNGTVLALRAKRNKLENYIKQLKKNKEGDNETSI